LYDYAHGIAAVLSSYAKDGRFSAIQTWEFVVTKPVSTVCKIALVDDHESVRVALSSLLRSYGYSTEGFDSAESLLALSSLEDYSCIISDLQMPGLNGLELLETLRGDGSRMPFILLTAFAEMPVRKRAMQAGACRVLSKPFDANELMRCLRKACGDADPSSQE
jgi:FixJ family two-component response regulator